jgi:cation diffusion facilitator family transporter
MITNETIIKKRQKVIVRTSAIGIFANLLLAGFKAFVGIITNSIAIVLDSINNFSDMLSAIITIIGIRFANKAPDKKHPMGHGRLEYIGTAIIAVIIMYIGVTAIIESVKKIINPEPVSYTTPSLIIITVAVAVKVILSIYYRKAGKKVGSGSLEASATDALFDAIISFATLISAIVYVTWGIATEAYLAVLISLVILYSGVKMLGNVFSVILGERVDPELSQNIKKSICEVDKVRGAFDLMIHDYGANMTYCSVNIEVDDDLTAREIDDISREVRRKVFYGYHIYICSVGIYSINTKNDKVNEVYHRVKEIISHYEHVIQIHGFHLDEKKKEISFDVVISFDAKNRRAYYMAIKRHLHRAFPKYKINLALDSDYSD